MSGNCLSFLKGVKDPFEAQEGRWDFSRDATAEVFLYLQQETWGSSRVMTGTSRIHSCGLQKVQSPCEL